MYFLYYTQSWLDFVLIYIIGDIVSFEIFIQLFVLYIALLFRIRFLYLNLSKFNFLYNLGVSSQFMSNSLFFVYLTVSTTFKIICFFFNSYKHNFRIYSLFFTVYIFRKHLAVSIKKNWVVDVVVFGRNQKLHIRTQYIFFFCFHTYL